MILLYSLFTINVHAYRIVNPLPFSVVRTDYVKFQLEIDENPVPDSVIFILIGKKIGEQWDTSYFKADKSFNYIYNTKPLVDNKYFLSAQIFIGNQIKVVGCELLSKGMPFILDRNESYSQKILITTFRKINEENQLNFECNNNKVLFNSWWNKDSLYFKISVKDQNLIFPVINDTMDNSFLRLWESDGIEISFDAFYNKSEFRNMDDYEFLLSIDSKIAGYRWNDSIGKIIRWGDNISHSLIIQGTLNNNNDADTGYIVIVAIPWMELDLQPYKGLKIGFDVQNFDRDKHDDFAFRASWSGVLRENNDNTSEWGTLMLDKSSLPVWAIYLFITLLLFVTVIIGIKIFRKRSLAENELIPENLSPPPVEVEVLRIKEIKQFIASHYENPELNREEIARYIRVAPSYLSTVFKKETGQGLNEYINSFRVQKAIELLKSSRHSISEIAFHVGFNTAKNFSRIFKEVTNMTPSEFREKNLG